MKDDDKDKTKGTDKDTVARENWQRYEYCRSRGHTDYVEKARRNEGMYLGDGLQWEKEDLDLLKEQRRPAYEFNEIMPSVNAALGYQIANRMDINYLPAGGEADEKTATLLSKIAMHICRNNQFHWRETAMLADGLIERRGFIDLRLAFNDNMRGDVSMALLDPRDAMPDPDAKSYDPEDLNGGWQDFTLSRWLTLDEIEANYGQKARDLAEEGGGNDSDGDFGDDEAGEQRNKFGNSNGSTPNDLASTWTQHGITRYRVIERQKRETRMSQVAVWPKTGDTRVIEGMPAEKIAALREQGVLLVRRPARRIRWMVSTYDRTLHNELSPYDFITVVPYFPFFRRGETRGIVDNGVGPQMALNKAVSQYVHIINSSANSGWITEEGSLANMTDEELEEQGAKTGLHISHKKGTTAPVKIQPNQIPPGVDKLIDRATAAVKAATVPDAMRGLGGERQSGIAIQSTQFSAQQQLAVPLDNLAQTRRMIASRILNLMQKFYDGERVMRIVSNDPATGRQLSQPVTINQYDPATDTFLNDMTVGEYDVAISDQPMQVTFENSQFSQIMEMRNAGVRIDDKYAIKYSNLADKREIVDEMAKAVPPADPEKEAKAKLLLAQAKKTDAEAAETRVDTQFSATQAARNIAAVPEAAPLADQMLNSAGFEDQDAAPGIPNVPAGIPTGLPAIASGAIPVSQSNTSPQFPANADAGLNTGIEGGGSNTPPP